MLAPDTTELDFTDYQTATTAVLDPTTSAEVLAAIAREHATLHMGIAMHPKANDGVLDYLVENGDEVIGNVVESRIANRPKPAPKLTRPVPPPPAPKTIELKTPLPKPLPTAVTTVVPKPEPLYCSGGHPMSGGQKFCTECGARPFGSAIPNPTIVAGPSVTPAYQPMYSPVAPPPMIVAAPTAYGTRGNGTATAGMVLGILAALSSFIPFINVFSIFLGIVAFFCGVSALSRIRRDRH